MRYAFVALAAVLNGGCFDDPPSDPAGTGDTTMVDPATSQSATITTTDESADGPTTATTATESSAGDECPPDSVCVPEAPTSWLGPIVFAAVDAGTSVPECSAPYSATITTLHDEVTAGSIDCGCGCEGPFCTAGLTMYDDLGCRGSGFGIPDVPVGECTPITGGSVAVGFYATTEQASCTPTQERTVLGPSSWTRDVELCGLGDALPTCGDGVCAPLVAPPFGAICIFKPGDHECPVDTSFTDRSVFYESFADRRTCADCACDLAAPDCTAQTFLSADAVACSDPSAPVLQCAVLGSDTEAAYWEPIDPGACTAQPQVVSGDVEPSGPSTVCCRA